MKIDLKYFLAKDLYRYAKNTKVSSAFLCFFTNPAFRFIFLMRLCRNTSKISPIGILSRVWYKRMQIKFGYQIPHSARIGAGLYLGHFGNIIINANVSMGENCNVAQGVTIGYVSAGKKKGYPKIGNKVWIGPNSVVVGNIDIGDNVLIAPLSFVNFDIPSDATFIQGKIIPNKGSNGYVNNTI